MTVYLVARLFITIENVQVSYHNHLSMIQSARRHSSSFAVQKQAVMANKTREELQAIFVTGAKPTQTDFNDWLDSYVHQTDEVPAGNITDDVTHRFVTDAQIAAWNNK